MHIHTHTHTQTHARTQYLKIKSYILIHLKNLFAILLFAYKLFLEIQSVVKIKIARKQKLENIY